MKFTMVVFLCIAGSAYQSSHALEFRSVRTVNNTTLVAYFIQPRKEWVQYSDYWVQDTVDISDISQWKVNNQQVSAIRKWVVMGEGCDHHVFLTVPALVNNTQYTVTTPYGTRTFTFSDDSTHCEGIKVNQAGYSARGNVRYALYAAYFGTAGSEPISGTLPAYKVIRTIDKSEVATGTLVAMGGKDNASGDYVYKIDLSRVPEGGPYKVVINGWGCSEPFGIGGQFAAYTAYTAFRGMMYQRCGIAMKPPWADFLVRENACHTICYNTLAPEGEANVVVKGTEPQFTFHGDYHDAGDADKRSDHCCIPMHLLTMYDMFPECFSDNQFRLPDNFDANWNPTGISGNGIPDIIDEAEWACLCWRTIQQPDGGVCAGIETNGYPVWGPLDQDTLKYGTFEVNKQTTALVAGEWYHFARLIKPYNAEKAADYVAAAERAWAYAGSNVVSATRGYFLIQKYLYTNDQADHDSIKRSWSDYWDINRRMVHARQASLGFYATGWATGVSHVASYIFHPAGVTVYDSLVKAFQDTIRKTADSAIISLRKYAYPSGCDESVTQGRFWGYINGGPKYMFPLLAAYKFTGDQKYMDAACEIYDHNLGLNPYGKVYMSGLGFENYRVWDPLQGEALGKNGTHKRGLPLIPGITVLGPGTQSAIGGSYGIPDPQAGPLFRQYCDYRCAMSESEYGIVDMIMPAAATYPVLAKGVTWDGKDPFTGAQSVSIRSHNTRASMAGAAERARISLSFNGTTLTIHFFTSGKTDGRVRLTICNPAGKRIASTTLDNLRAGENIRFIDCGKYMPSPGIYMCTVCDGEKRFCVKSAVIN